jgi:hypothetical protein
MDKGSLASAVLVAAVAGAGMYYMNAASERHIADLHRQLATLQQLMAERAKAAKSEEEARRAGDLAVQRALAEERAQRDAEAKRTADAAKAMQERAAAAERAARER